MEATPDPERHQKAAPKRRKLCEIVIQFWTTLMSKIKTYFTGKGKQSLNAVWYIFIIMLVGQIGPLIEYAKALWSGDSVWSEIQKSAAKGELLTCAIAILAAGTFFLVKEYNSPKQIGGRTLKSLLLLWTIICGLGCVLISVELLSLQKFTSQLQSGLHWFFYAAAMITAFLLWMLEEWQTSAAEEIMKINVTASTMTVESEKTKTSTGMKV